MVWVCMVAFVGDGCVLFCVLVFVLYVLFVDVLYCLFWFVFVWWVCFVSGLRVAGFVFDMLVWVVALYMWWL